jgi:3-phosphoshikimate 1-carboxyvinyltransferase
MAESLEITPVTKPIRGRTRPPGSKSITNRALVCAALSDGMSTLRGALDSEDTRVMIESLAGLGIVVQSRDHRQTLEVSGSSGQVPALDGKLFCANSGTTIRFLTALTTLGHGSFQLDGVARMRERPIGDLIDALQQLGARLVSENGDRCPPVVVHANGLRGGVAKVRGDISSQFLSAVLMTAPAASSPVELVIDGTLVSQPYVEMTCAVMQAFGVEVETVPDLSRKSFARATTRSNPTPQPQATSGPPPRSRAAKLRSTAYPRRVCRAT